ADIQLRLGNVTAARDLYATALRLREEWVRLDPNSADAKKAVPDSHLLVGQVSLQLGDLNRAAAELRAADAKYAALPVTPAIRLERASVRKLLGDAETRLGHPAEAETH